MTLEIGQVLKDRYRIESVLGEGGMGTVYMAQDTLLERPRALKELYPDPLASEAKLLAARKQFEQEAQALAKLRHPNLPHVSDYFSVDEYDYLVMDYVEGESLADILNRKKRPTEPLALDWLAQIVDALTYCHSHHIVHRDIKPANLILTPDGRVVLVDFGLVKMVDPHNPKTATIVRGLGTPQYTPLEQYDHSVGHTDARSDIYALGATFYHLLTGRAPQPVSQRILNPDSQPPIQQANPKVSTWMARYVQKAMAIRPEDRHKTTREMKRELESRVFKLKTTSRSAAPAGQPATESRAAHTHTTAKVVRPSDRDLRTARSRAARSTRAYPRSEHYRRLAAARAADKQRSATNPPTSGSWPDDLRRLAPAALPMAVPVFVVLTLTVALAFVFSTGSSLLATAVIAPLVFSAWAYYKLFKERRKGPPRF